MAAKQNPVILALLSGAAGAVATTAAVIAAFGRAKDGDAWGPINAISHIVFGEKAASIDGFHPKETLTGLGLNTGAVGLWAAIYEKAAGKVPFPQSLAAGALASAVIYAVDYHVAPPRLRPGFEKRTGPAVIFATYILLAVTLGLAPLLKKTAATLRDSGDSDDGNA